MATDDKRYQKIIFFHGPFRHLRIITETLGAQEFNESGQDPYAFHEYKKGGSLFSLLSGRIYFRWSHTETIIIIDPITENYQKLFISADDSGNLPATLGKLVGMIERYNRGDWKKKNAKKETIDAKAPETKDIHQNGSKGPDPATVEAVAKAFFNKPKDKTILSISLKFGISKQTVYNYRDLYLKEQGKQK